MGAWVTLVRVWKRSCKSGGLSNIISCTLIPKLSPGHVNIMHLPHGTPPRPLLCTLRPAPPSPLLIFASSQMATPLTPDSGDIQECFLILQWHGQASEICTASHAPQEPPFHPTTGPTFWGVPKAKLLTPTSLCTSKHISPFTTTPTQP